jgi:hypothetical protein
LLDSSAAPRLGSFWRCCSSAGPTG